MITHTSYPKIAFLIALYIACGYAGAKADNSSLTNDKIRLRLHESQEQGQPGYGAASVGDRLAVELNTSSRCKKVVFQLVDKRTGKPLIIDGKTEFVAPYDPDTSGQSWVVTVPISEKSQREFKTETPADIEVAAEVEGGVYTRLTAVPSFGFDFTIGRKASSDSAVQNADAPEFGRTLLECDFNDGADPRWKIITGSQWTCMRGRFGDVSDSYGPDQTGNWAAAGEQGWTNYDFSADIAETIDGMGIVIMAVRFQNPRNYYALEWVAEENVGFLRLVRCRDGLRFEIAKATGLRLDKLPLRLGITVCGDWLCGTLNGTQVLSGYAGDFASGQIAVGEIDRMALIDNVKVTQIVSSGKESSFFRDIKTRYAITPRYFLRDSGTINIPFEIINSGEKYFERARVRISIAPLLISTAGDVLTSDDPNATASQSLVPAKTVDIARLDARSSTTVSFPLDTRLLKQGEYILRIQSSIGGENLIRDEVVYIGIARNWNPERFNYFSWGMVESEADIKEYAEHGFTMGLLGDGHGTELDWEHNGKPVPDANRPKSYGQIQNPPKFAPFDYCLKYGLLGGINLITYTYNESFFPSEMYGRSGNGTTTMLLPYHPKFHEYSVNLARTFAQKYSAFPACRLFNINTETEYMLQPDFSEIGLARARELFGSELPKGCADNTGIPGNQVPGLVTNGIVNEDHPVARYYRWFWLDGEGYNLLARDMAQTVREVNPDILVFHDPAERMPFVRDRHTGLHPWDWTYTAPSPMNMIYKTEVLRAMAKPPYDKICNEVQILWKAKIVSPHDECPSAAIIRLALLYMTSRPIYATGHWNADWMRHSSNLDRWQAVKDVHDTFWEPLGPVLTSLKTDAPREVAFLVSSNNQLFRYKNRGSNWTWEYSYAAWHECFLRAGLPVDIIFEESVAEGKLSKYKAVFIPFGELIGKSAYDKVISFTKSGGKVFADRNLGYEVPGAVILKADPSSLDFYRWVWSSADRISANNRAEIISSAAEEIARSFAEYRAALVVSDDNRLIVNTRMWQDIPYVFAINDNRSAGSQVGQYGVMLENGEPLTAAITLPSGQNAAAVYDLVENSIVQTRQTDRGLSWTKEYAPASGTLFAVLPQEIAGLELTVPDKPVETGNAFSITACLLDSAGKLVRGRLPLRLTIRNSQGIVSEYSDVFAFTDGRFEKTGIIALNDVPGTWSVRIDDMASGRSATKYFQIRPKSQ